MKKKEAEKIAKEIKQKKRALKKLDAAIGHHERMRGAYFWYPPSYADGRRRYEDNNSQVFTINLTNGYIFIEQKTECSCKNVYYRMNISLVMGGKTVESGLNLRFLNQLYDTLI